MIFLLTPDHELDFITACGFDKISGARLYTLFRCYGYDTRFCLFWLQTGSDSTPVAAISLFDSRLSVSAKDEADFEELSAFADMVGGSTRIEASPRVCEALGRRGRYSETFVMRYDGSGFDDDFSGVSHDAGLREIYDMLAGTDAGFAGSDLTCWYTHTSRLFRRSLGSAAVIRDDGQAVATAGIYTTGINTAIIGEVATLPDYRGKGYAAKLVRYLANRILQDGREPVLVCKTDKLAGYYSRMGFDQAGNHGEITI